VLVAVGVLDGGLVQRGKRLDELEARASGELVLDLEGLDRLCNAHRALEIGAVSQNLSPGLDFLAKLSRTRSFFGGKR